MDARTSVCLRGIPAAGLLFLLALVGTTAEAAGFRTQNFIIQAPTPALARSVGEAAENYRDQLAEYWLGQRLPPWPTPCPVRVVSGPNLAAQGVTTYNRSPVRDFQMEVVGTPERILDSVLPHEVTHTVLATHFGRPLPRWADEGICTTVEHESERSKHEAKLREFLGSRRGIAMNRLFLLTEYPSDVLPMYAQGYSVCRFLIEQQDAQTFITFLQDYMQNPSWTANIKKHYGYDSLAQLQEYWLAWVAEGSGPVAKFAKLQPRTSNPGSRSSNPNLTPSSPQSAIALASGQSPPFQQQPNRLNAPTVPRDIASQDSQATALASLSDGGWYKRQQQIHQTGAAVPVAANQPNAGAGLASNAISRPPENRQGPDNRQGVNDPRANGQQSRVATSGNQDDWQSQAIVRQRNQQPIAPMMPPSVRNSGRYSSAQPQPEMGMSRGGSDLNSAANWADGTARYR
ncbi:hypothetical protein N9N28_02595 [Rubripirellula amarantea]|nr:hypothetical protein [Rubripirellula amarantea]